MADNNEGSCYIAMARTLWANKEEHGIWDMLRATDGGVRSFDSVSQAKDYAESSEEYAGRNYFIVRILG